MLLHKALKLSALIGALSAADASLTAVPSEGVNILEEVDGQGGFSGRIGVVSNVPVTLDNYFGSGTFAAGAPLEKGQVKVLVTSNCDTSQHDVASKISLDETAGTISVNLNVAEGAGATMPFLEPSSFDAKWQMEDFWCGQLQSTGPALLADPATSDGCRVCMNPKTGVCEDSQAMCFVDPCDDAVSPCGEGETCEANYCGGCHAICSGGLVTVTAPTRPSTCEPNAECFAEGSTCAAGEESCCGVTYNSMECECTDMDGKLKYLCMATDACFLPCANEQLPAQLPQVTSTVAPPTEAAVVVTTTAATAAATTTTAPQSTDGKSGDSNALGGVDPSPASTQQRCFAVSFVVVIVLVSLLLPGQDKSAQGWFGVGAVVVAAVSLSAVPPKKNGIARNNVERASAHTRGLQETCSFNVEILYDGCAQSISVDAPSARVVDVSLENFTSTDLGDCDREYSVTLAFPVTDTTRELELPANNTVDKLPEWGSECAMIAIGRPYIDTSGEMLKAMPIVHDMKKMNSIASVSWSGEVDVGDASISSSDNVTDHNRFLLGEEWTERGLAEHASVASFSAFSIALMTNNAPSDLVEDALKAGMDEIRHARISFEVATKLVGKHVAPGPLPPSTHKFGDDLTSLALAVAREGCVDETLSAIVADLEADDINRVLEEGTQDSIYSSIERDTLTWIKKEMQTIAKEESSHAALAWRTLSWVCDIDSDACEAVHRDVFDEASLELRFNQRAMNALSDMSLVRNKLNEDWAKLLEVHRLVRSDSDISHVKKSICDEPEDSLRGIPAAVLRGIIC
mmetsp:Transcript_3257/g.5457  ORF Transcript_3257/g.5457 Transcript_3257/m.5457 type:complete len:800 (+) Transcript_3257:77-2476(+)